jgi:hypothetical protein
MINGYFPAWKTVINKNIFNNQYYNQRNLLGITHSDFKKEKAYKIHPVGQFNLCN